MWLLNSNEGRHHSYFAIVHDARAVFLVQLHFQIDGQIFQQQIKAGL